MRRRHPGVWQGALMAVIALVLLIWLCLNVALVVFRWIYLDRSDELPRHALNTAPLPTRTTAAMTYQWTHRTPRGVD